METNAPKHPSGGQPHPDTGRLVEIILNGQPRQVHRGHTTVAELKAFGNIPLAHELEQIEAGQMLPLADNGAVTLKGGEVFVSHPRDSASS